MRCSIERFSPAPSCSTPPLPSQRWTGLQSSLPGLVAGATDAARAASQLQPLLGPSPSEEAGPAPLSPLCGGAARGPGRTRALEHDVRLCPSRAGEGKEPWSSQPQPQRHAGPGTCLAGGCLLPAGGRGLARDRPLGLNLKGMRGGGRAP